jgi:hypothetical protein
MENGLMYDTPAALCRQIVCKQDGYRTGSALRFKARHPTAAELALAETQRYRRHGKKSTASALGNMPESGLRARRNIYMGLSRRAHGVVMSCHGSAGRRVIV